jgi:hypothetical protein
VPTKSARRAIFCCAAFAVRFVGKRTQTRFSR